MTKGIYLEYKETQGALELSEPPETVGAKATNLCPCSFMLKLHQQILERIQAELDSGMQTFFLLGDRGVGKRTIVHRLLPDNEAMLFSYEKFSVQQARDLKQTCSRKSDIIRFVLIESDNASKESFNAILKLLEEPPSGNIFFVVGSYVRLATVNSRCSHILVPKFTNEELLEVLLFKGMSERIARQVVPYSSGSCEKALTVYSHLEEKRKFVNHIKALVEGDIDFVLRQVKYIVKYDIDLLIELTDDILFARYGLVTNEYVSINVQPDFLSKMRAALISSRMPESAWLSAWFQTR